MPFWNPIVFWTGLAAVAAPVIIHLLNRRRFRVRPWAAMQFLLDSLRRNRRRLRIEELILLALRCLIVLVLAATLARFTGCGMLDVLPGAGSGQQSVVFVLDDSCSMGQRQPAEPIFAAAKADLADRIKALPETATVAIVLTSHPSAREAFLTPKVVTDREGLLARLANLPLSDTRARLDDAFAAAGDLFGPGARRVYVYSDFRQADLADSRTSAGLKKQFARLTDAGAEVIAVDYGGEGRNNLTVESIELVDKFALARGPKGPSRLAVTVRNNGASRVERVEVKLAARFGGAPASAPAPGGAESPDAQLPVLRIDALNPGQSRRLEFNMVFPHPGPAAVTATLDADELLGDNTRSVAIDVRNAIRILVADGRPDLADRTEAESFFLVNALDDGAGGYGNRCDVISVEGLASVRLDDYDMIVLADVPELPQIPGQDGQLRCPLAEALGEYVSAGGGLVVFLGDQTNPKFQNEVMFPVGLAPLLIGQRVGDPRNRDEFFRLDPKRLAAEPMLRAFAGDAAAFASLIRFNAFWPAQERSAAAPTTAAKPPRVLACFSDSASSPAIVAQERGAGRVLTFYTSASTRWNDWAIDEVGTFPTVMLDMVEAVSRPQAPLTANVGEPIVRDLDRRQADARATLRPPRYPVSELQTLQVAPTERGAQVRYDRPLEAGLYTLSLALPNGSVSETLLARNVEAAEGDLRPAKRAGLVAVLGGEKFTYIDRRQSPTRLADVRHDDYSNWLIGLLLALLALEVFLGQKFGHYAPPARGGRPR